VLFAPPGWELEHGLAATPLTLTYAVRAGERRGVARRLAPRIRDELWAVEALAREAALLEQLGARVTPRLFDRGRDAHGPFHVAERLPWPALEQLRGEARGVAGPLAAACFRALAGLHELGVVHGDVAPGNVLAGRGGEEARLVDLVLARPFGERPPLGVQGTLAYLAPEAAREEAAAPAADVFAMAVTLLELFGGVVPRLGGPAEVLVAAAEVPLEGWARSAATGLERDLASALLACVDPDPSRRPAAAEAAARALRGR
jgi:serine/threonine-protein kinase